MAAQSSQRAASPGAVLEPAPRRRALAPAAIAGIGAALPPSRSQAEMWTEFFAGHYGHGELAEKLWHRCGIERRHAVLDPTVEDVRQWGTDRRMRRFVEEGLPLGAAAVDACLEDAGLERSDVGLLEVVSCTGYATPGIDILLARDLGLSDSTQRLHVGHMGCYAAVPGLSAVADAATARGKVAVMLCLELTSLHIQPPSEDLEQLVAHALFSDAAVAAAVVPDGPGFEVVDVVARTDVAESHMMRWDVTDMGFRMGLSPQVPDVLERHVEAVVEELLAPEGLDVWDVAGWAVHPGGPRILDVVAGRLGLEDGALSESHAVLRDHGNCSSATVLLVLERVRRERALADGDPILFMSFGPGLTLYAALLRVRSAGAG